MAAFEEQNQLKHNYQWIRCKKIQGQENLEFPYFNNTELTGNLLNFLKKNTQLLVVKNKNVFDLRFKDSGNIVGQFE
jgi:hypothetical protein